MKRFLKKKKKSASEVGSLASGGKSESGYDINTKKDLAKLHKAAYTGDISKLKSLLKKGDVNQLDKENRTPLHLACSNGKIDAIMMLAGHHGCNLNLCDNDKRSPLMICVQCQFYNCMNILLQKDADPNLSDNNGNTALHLAASIPSNDLCISLIDYHADVHAKNKDGSTPLHLATSAAESENVMKALLEDGALINAKDNNGKTPLMLAASRGHLDVVKDLLNKGADSSLRDAKGWCADDYASMSGHHPVSHVIVEHAMKQKKTPSRPSLHNASTGSGSRLYEDIPAVSAGGKQQSSDIPSAFLVGGPALDAGDLSQDEESHSLSRLSDDKSSWNSDSDSPEPKKPASGSKVTMPIVNVAQFLKQQQQSKNQSPSSPSSSAKPTSSRSVDVKEDVPTTPPIRNRGYNSNSQKGGQVSPAKPPLPMARGGGIASPALLSRDRHEDDADSPWDSEEESDDGESDHKQDGLQMSPARFSKPSRDIMADLGLSDADINRLYDKNQSDVSSIRSQSPEKQGPSMPVYSTVEKKKLLPLDNSESEDDESSNWDDSDPEEDGPREHRALTDVIAASSALKFDDELSEENDVIENAVAPSNVLQQIADNEVRDDDDDDDDDSSSWDSEKIVELPDNTTPQPSPFKTTVDGIMESSEEESGDDTESESSWEIENRKKSEKNKQSQDEDRKRREEEEQLKKEEERIRKEQDELQRKRELQRLEDEKRRKEEEQRRQEEEQQQKIEEEEQRKRKMKEEEERRKQQAKKDKQMKIAMEAMEKKRKNEEEKQRKEEEEKIQKVAEERRRVEEDQRRRKQKEAEEKRRREVEEKKLQEEERRKTEEEERKMKEEEQRRRLLASNEKEKLTTALQDALDGAGNPSESDISELEDPHMGNVQTASKRKKYGQKQSNVALPPMYSRRDPSYPSQKVNGINGIDIDNLTGTETETEDEFPAEMPASLRSSQLSEALLRSGERGELEREASREKHRAVDALERLDYSKRENEKQREEIRDLKREKEEWGKMKDDFDSRMRKINFELIRTKEQLETSQLEADTSRDRHKRLEERLEIDAAERRRQESALTEMRSELEHTEDRLKEAEKDRDKLQTELSVERRNLKLREQVDVDMQRTGADFSEQTSTMQRQVKALNLLLQERDDELAKAKAEMNTLESTCNRYEDELKRWRSNDDDRDNFMAKLNSELNERAVEFERKWHESREALDHQAVKYNMQLHNLKQAHTMLTEELRKERKQKSDAQLDLETLNEQQRALKDNIADFERKWLREQDKSESLTKSVKEEREKRENAEKKLRDSEISANLAQQEANSLRTTLTHKDSLLIQAQRERDETREKLNRREVEANELQRDNVRMSGRVEILEAEVSQQESEKMRMRRELEDARNFGTSTITEQQGKLSELVTGQHKERIELEKRNAQLDQQVSHLRDEINRINEEKLKKEEELAVAQQDRIETHKRMSFTEPSMTQMRNDKNKMEVEVQQLKERCSSLDARLQEETRAAEHARSELVKARETGTNANTRLQSVETISAHDKDTIQRLEDQLKAAETTNTRLEAEVAAQRTREEEIKSSQDFASRSRKQMEELVARLQEDKTSAEQKMQEKIDRCRILESEAEGHRKMWEEEVKMRSKLTVQYARADKERNDALARLESSRTKYSRATEQRKNYRSKLELQKRHNAKLEEQIDSYSDIARSARLQSESSESEFEMRLSRASDDFRSERRRLNDTVELLRGQVTALGQRLKEESRARNGVERERERFAETSRNSDASIADVERERDALRNEVKRLKQSGASDSSSPDQIKAMVNAGLNTKLDQVNHFLEGQAAAHEILERLRVENEEKRVAEANERTFALEHELNVLKARLSNNSSGPDSDRRRRELQDSVRDNIKLQEELQRTKRDLEERKIQVEHEKKKHQELFASVVSGTMSGKLGGGSLPLNHTLGTGLSPDKTRDHVLTSTPRREMSEPILSHLRNKLDVSLAQRLTESRLQKSGSPSSDASGSNQRRPDRSASNEYMSFLLT